MTTHTLRALVRYDRMQPKLRAMLDRIGGNASFAAWQAADRRELMLVQLAFYRDTHRINTLENCLRVTDVEWMRRTGHLDTQPKKTKP